VGDGQAALEADFVGTHRVEDDLAFVAVGARKSVVGAELGVRQGSHPVAMIGR
jgi:hypothetical protein